MMDAWTSPEGTCEFYVEDVAGVQRRYVVKLKLRDLPRVRCRTIRRHLVASPGFPYLPHQFCLWSNGRMLHEDDVAAAFHLEPGATLQLQPLFQSEPLERSAPRPEAVCASPDSSPPPNTPPTSAANSDVTVVDDIILQGLNPRQRKLQEELLSEFRRQSLSPKVQEDTSCASSPPMVHNPILMERRPASHSTSPATRATSLYEDDDNSTRLLKQRTNEQPSDDSNVIYTVGSTRTVATPTAAAAEVVPVSRVKLDDIMASPMATTNTNHRIVGATTTTTSEQRSEDESNDIATLKHDVVRLMTLVETLSSAKRAAQTEMSVLLSRLDATERQNEVLERKNAALHRSAVDDVAHFLQQSGFRIKHGHSDAAAIVTQWMQRQIDTSHLDSLQRKIASLQTQVDMETARRRQLQLQMESLKGHVRVVVRVRPPMVSSPQNNVRTIDDEHSTVWVDASRGALQVATATSGTRTFDFYRVLTEHSSQEDVYSEVSPLVQQCVLDEVNCAVFAYGQTGSGKTHTILGQQGTDERGVVPRTLSEVFNLLQEQDDTEHCVACSVAELYNDHVTDLLLLQQKSVVTSSSSTASPSSWVQIQVRNETEAMELLASASQLRQTHATKRNTLSSRSHLFFVVHVTTRKLKCPSVVKTAKLMLVDLAGSERVGQSGSTGERLKEAQFINKSLAALGDVVAALSSGHPSAAVGQTLHIPYRNSKLTMILQDVVGGSSKTVLIACVAPFERLVSSHAPRVTNVQETLSTLQFAARVRTVKNAIQSQYTSTLIKNDGARSGRSSTPTQIIKQRRASVTPMKF